MMGLFSITVAPIWYLLIISFYRRPSRPFPDLLIPWLWGVLVGMPTVLITLGVLSRIPFSLSFKSLYLWSWIRGTGWALCPVVLSLIAYFHSRPTSYSRIRQISGCLCGTATVYCIWYALIKDPGFDAYRIFFLPTVFLGAITTTAIVIDQGFRMERWTRYGMYSLAICLPSIFSLLPVLYANGERVIAWSIGLLCAIGAPFVVLQDSRGRLR